MKVSVAMKVLELASPGFVDLVRRANELGGADFLDRADVYFVYQELDKNTLAIIQSASEEVVMVGIHPGRTEAEIEAVLDFLHMAPDTLQRIKDHTVRRLAYIAESEASAEADRAEIEKLKQGSTEDEVFALGNLRMRQVSIEQLGQLSTLLARREADNQKQSKLVDEYLHGFFGPMMGVVDALRKLAEIEEAASPAP